MALAQRRSSYVATTVLGLICLLTPAASRAQALVKVHVFGVTESVADFQKSVTNKFSKTMVLAPTRDDADLAIEIQNRDTRAFGSRSVSLVVHHRAGSEKMLRFPTGVGGGFRMTAGLAAIADETMKLIDNWLIDNRDAVTGKADAKAVTMPLVKLDAVDALVTALSSSRSDLARANAASVMYQIGDQKLLEALALALQKDSSTRVRRASATSLGSWPNRQAVDPLILALGDREPNVRKDAVAALQKISQQNFGEDAARWREWWAAAKGGGA